LELWGAVNRQKALTLAQQVKDTVRILFIGFTGTILHRFPLVTDRLAVDQADPIAAALEPFVERWPVNTRGLHGDQHPLTFVFDQVRPEGLFEAPEALAGMRQCKRTTAHGGLRPQTCTVFGFAHIDAYEEEGGLGHILFTLIGVSSILLQSHGTYLLLG